MGWVYMIIIIIILLEYEVVSLLPCFQEHDYQQNHPTNEHKQDL